MCIEINREERKLHIAKIVKSHKEGMNPCLSCKVAPKLGYNYGKETKVVNGEERQFNFEEFTFYCPSCGFKSHTVNDIIAAISGWHTTNTPGNEFYADRWIEQREKQKAQEEQAA